MARAVARLTILSSCLILIFLTAANAEPEGRRLDGVAINELLYGATIYGVYVDGRPDWAEQTAVTGQLYDARDGWSEVGRWGVLGDLACYSYFDARSEHCYEVYESEDRFYFYLPGGEILVAYTTRIERDQVM